MPSFRISERGGRPATGSLDRSGGQAAVRLAELGDRRLEVVEPFSREKIVSGVRKACQGRPVTDTDLAILAQRVEETIRATGAAQVEANDIGLAILTPLRELDEVAYLRFASVYQGFDSLDDFESAITLLRVEDATKADATRGTSAKAESADR